MNTPSAEGYVLPRWLRSWEQFWFTPADPTVLALMRMSCGLVLVYTMFVYSFKLQEFVGEHAWHDLSLQSERIHDRPVQYSPLDWNAAGQLPPPRNKVEEDYVRDYRKTWGFKPPPPYPSSPEQAEYLHRFRTVFGFDLRLNGLKPTDDEVQRKYAEAYTQKWNVIYPRNIGPPPAYPKSDAEAEAVDDYISRWGIDPRRLHVKGSPVFSIWLHVTDPTAMMCVHSVIVFVCVLFTIGFCTRITSALAFFAHLNFIHRNPTALFGVDTMMVIVLFYLMIGPSGAVYSVDRMIRKWWVTAKPAVVAWWYGLLRRPVPAGIAPADPVPDTPTPTIVANVAIRLLQIHVCIVYLYAGISKLQGTAWWTGGALWLTLGNYEFAPMQFDLYLSFIRLLGKHQLLYDAFMTFGGMFTLAFEIGYAFLIWRPKLRWIYLGAAILLHGGIGLFMGLKTFSLMMLVMNMAFLRKEEAAWILTAPMRLFRSPPRTTALQPAAEAAPAK